MAALVYAAVFVLALVPGLPLGFAVFGRRHPAAWISGALFGYAITAIAVWVPLRAGLPSTPAFALAWLAACGLTFGLLRGRAEAGVALHPWRRDESMALALVVAIALLIAIPPIARAGARDADGHRYYRAYFTADFVWHMALAAELSKSSMPPRNPYLATERIHYYWTYFLLPSSAAGTTARAGSHADLFLKINAIGTAVLFVSAIFLCAWTALPRAWPAAAGVLLAILASSAEGTYALWRLWAHGQPLAGVRDLNIDALSSWWLGGLRIDGLQRCFWWVPQHSMAYALGLIALAVVNAARSAGSMTAIGLAGIALAASAAMNPFVGGVFALVWGGAIVIDSAGAGALIARTPRHALAIVPVALALAWCATNSMVQGAGGALQFGWLGEARTAPLATLLLSLGPALIPAVVGVLARASRHTASTGNPPRSPLEPGSQVSLVCLASASLLLMYFVRLDVDRSWVGFRAGQMFLVAVPALVARGLATAGRARSVAVVVLAVAFTVGLPTTAIDAYNAQDITNFNESPIGPWTVTVTRDEDEALTWLQRATPKTAIVQMDAVARGRETWSLIPSFAQRRMAAGLPISLLDMPVYHDRSARVQRMYATADAREAWEIARGLRIDYIWIDRVERGAYGGGMDKFGDGQYFAAAFRNAEVTIYRVQ